MSQSQFQIQSLRLFNESEQSMVHIKSPKLKSTNELNSKNTQNPRPSRKSIWNSEWDHSYKHRLNEQLTKSRQHYSRRIMSEQSLNNYFQKFNKMPFDIYVHQLNIKPEPQITIAQVRRNRKIKEFSLKKLVDESLKHHDIEKQNHQREQDCLQNIQIHQTRIISTPQPKNSMTSGNYYYHKKIASLQEKIEGSQILKQSQSSVDFRKFTANNLHSIIQRQRVQENKGLKPENFKLVTEFIETYKTSPVRTFLEQGIKPKYRIAQALNHITQSMRTTFQPMNLRQKTDF